LWKFSSIIEHETARSGSAVNVVSVTTGVGRGSTGSCTPGFRNL